MENTYEFMCSFCGVKACSIAEEKKRPKFCPMPVSEEIIEETRDIYLENEDIRSLALESARVESAGYCQWTRIEETINFAKRLGVFPKELL